MRVQWARACGRAGLTGFLLTLLVLASGSATDVLEVHFFGSSTCTQCQEIIRTVLQPFAARHPAEVRLQLHYLEERGEVRRMMRMEARYGAARSSPQELYFGDRYLFGYDEIMAEAPGQLARALAARAPAPGEATGPDADAEERLSTRVRSFTLLGIVAAGLVDGVNPCAIATMIFLISFLTVQKRSRLEILWIGFSYTAAVYVTYLLLGLGAFTLLTRLGAYGVLAATLRWTAVIFAAGVGILSFWDALAYWRTGREREITLQLPKPVKLRIHKVISGNLRRHQIFGGAVAAGFLVTLLEAVCTGQVYLPTIVLMTRTSGLRLVGWLYLLLYNFLFVLPLLVVMVLAYFGLTWEKLAALTKERLCVLKLLAGSVLLGLAAFLAFS
jgi:hypothetical protein